MVINKHGKQLYKEITDSVKKNILPYVRILLDDTDEQMFLEKFNDLWENHYLAVGMVSDISMYLDKNYVAKEKLKSIKEMGTLVFKKHILKNEKVYDRFFTLIFFSIEEERNGNQIQTDVLRKCIKILLDLGIKSTSVYKKEFES